MVSSRDVRRATSKYSAANPKPLRPMPPHSVVTNHLVDEEGEPTRAALDEILLFFKQKLTASTEEHKA